MGKLQHGNLLTTSQREKDLTSQLPPWASFYQYIPGNWPNLGSPDSALADQIWYPVLNLSRMKRSYSSIGKPLFNQCTWISGQIRLVVHGRWQHRTAAPPWNSKYYLPGKVFPTMLEYTRSVF